MNYLIFFLSGLLTALPFLVTELWIVEWISIIPLFYLATRVKKRYLHGLCFGMGFYLPLYYWFLKLYPMDFVGFTPIEGGITVLLCWFGLSLLQASEMAFIPMVYARVAYKTEGKRLGYMLNPFLAAACFTVFEWMQSLFWHGVPWGRLALSQIGFLPMVQSASLLGSIFICFLIALTNGAFATVLPILHGRLKASCADRKWRIRTALVLLLILVIPLANGIFGAVRLAVTEGKMKDSPTVRVALIQGNIASGDKWRDPLSVTVDKYLSMSQEAVDTEHPDIVLWPETVVTAVLSEAGNYRWKLSDFAARNEVMLVVGAYARDEDGGRTNALWCFKPDGSIDENVYAKRHLVPFGEYLPMAWLFEHIPFLAELNLSESALTPGKDSELFTTPWGMMGGLVCFDSIYDTLARDSVRDGANLLLLSTNDSWYRDSHAIYQHNAHARLRAIETGKAIGRAANTGISTLILPNGEVTSGLAPLVQGTLVGELPLMEGGTLYLAVGNLIVPIAFALLIAGVVLRIMERRNRSREFDK